MAGRKKINLDADVANADWPKRTDDTGATRIAAMQAERDAKTSKTKPESSPRATLSGTVRARITPPPKE